MQQANKKWGLGVKLVLAGLPFLLLGWLSIGLTLWVSWQLDGGAAAVNEAGRIRMQTYRLALTAHTSQGAAAQTLSAQITEFEHSLALLQHGDAERPLFVPWDDTIRARFVQVQGEWQIYRAQLAAGNPELSAHAARFVEQVDAFVAAIETHLSRWTAILYLLQMAIMALAVLGALAVLYIGYLLVLEPVHNLKRAIENIQHGDFGARVQKRSNDEFGTLAEGFNSMAEHLQSMYRNLESKVALKTAELEEKRERLQTLYDVSALASTCTVLEELAQGFAERIARAAHASGVAVRWSDETNQRYLMLAQHGLPPTLVSDEHCLPNGSCHCGASQVSGGMRVIPLHVLQQAEKHCAHAGYETVIAIPVVLHDKLMGEVNLFFAEQRVIHEAERSLLETLTAHLAVAMENLRVTALEKEAAVAQERTFLARELHDSIAQSLAFLKIQVQLMRDALQKRDEARIQLALADIDTGVRESYADVRELLLHFRTRANAEDIVPALISTLRKFEHQSGLQTSLQVEGNGIPLTADVQIQVLHIVQEALSNVRKHAQAQHVWLDVCQQPHWRFEVRDDGRGFASEHTPGEMHVGLRIMQERAEKLGAQFEVLSIPERGTSVILELPFAAGAAMAA